MKNKVMEGFISTISYDATPQQFSFSQSKTGALTELNMGEVEKVEYSDGTLFEKHHISIDDISKTYLYRTEADYGPKLTGDLFVQKILSGAVSLYRFVDKYDISHFFYKSLSDSEIIYLQNHTYVDNKSVIQNDNSYKNEIIFLAQKAGCDLDRNMMEKLPYQLSWMIRVFKMINKCKGSEPDNLYSRQSMPQFNLGIVAGAAIMRTRWIQNPDRTANMPVAPELGGAIILQAAKKSYAFGLNAVFTTFKTEVTSKNGTFGNTTGVDDESKLFISPFARLYISQEKARVFFDAALVFPITLKSDVVFRNSSGAIISNQNYIPGFRGMMISPGLGIHYWKFTVQANYFFNATTSIKSSSAGLLVGYTFL